MEEVMTVEEIQKRYDSEWVLLSDPVVNEWLEVLSGKVVIHSKNRDEVYRKAADLRLKRSAFLFTGQIPEDTAVIQ